jgi:hypothetical protein
VRHEHSELADAAYTADPGANRVASGANPTILGLDVETLPEVEPVAIVVQLCPYALAPAKDEVDAVTPGQRSTGQCLDWKAFRTMAGFLPPQPALRSRAHGDTHDQALFDAHDSHALSRLRLGIPTRQQRRQEGENRVIQGEWPVIAVMDVSGEH